MFCKLICGDVIDGAKTLEPDSVDLIVTSPPYNVQKAYEENVSQEEYTSMIHAACKEFRRVLKCDGRFAINVPLTMTKLNISRDGGEKHIIRLVMHDWETAILASGLKIRDYIVWNQSNSGNDTSWGSFQSASSPWIRHQAEIIIIGHTGRWKKIDKGKSTIESEEFTRWTTDMWTMSCARHKEHPAVFPEELPTRCIKLFSYVGDVILDPFCGTGTTPKVALDLKRSCIGIDKSKKYCDITKERVGFFQTSLSNFFPGTREDTVKYIYEVIGGD